MSLLKQSKPSTSSRRHRIALSHAELWKGSPYKPLVSSHKSTGGRNNQGRITCRHKGGGHKRLYRHIDFARQEGVCVVERLEYDPNRSAHIALVSFESGPQQGKKAYQILPKGVVPGQKLESGSGSDIRVGSCLPLGEIPSGSSVFGIEFKIGKGAQCVRSAGNCAKVLGRDMDDVLVRLPSGEVRRFHKMCRATIGEVSNENHFNIALGKAGANRWRGKRPAVRGVAMNPIDHPHGGGEGKTSGGRHPVTPWGKPTKGAKTRHKPRTDRFIVRRRGG